MVVTDLMMRLTYLLVPMLIICGCDLLSGEAAEPIDCSLFPLQIAIESYSPPAGGSHVADIPDTAGHDTDTAHHADTTTPIHTELASVAVLSVVDSTALETEAEEPEEGAEAEALRRERVVRQAINSALVANTLIDVVQPDQASSDKAREEIIAKNSAALSTPLANEMRQLTGADIIVCAMIDRLGADVNIVAQSTHDGKLVYQDTIKDWEVVVGAPDENAE